MRIAIRVARRVLQPLRTHVYWPPFLMKYRIDTHSNVSILKHPASRRIGVLGCSHSYPPGWKCEITECEPPPPFIKRSDQNGNLQIELEIVPLAHSLLATTRPIMPVPGCIIGEETKKSNIPVNVEGRRIFSNGRSER